MTVDWVSTPRKPKRFNFNFRNVEKRHYCHLVATSQIVRSGLEGMKFVALNAKQ